MIDVQSKRGKLLVLKQFIANSISSITGIFDFGEKTVVSNPYNEYTWVYACIRAISTAASAVPILLKDQKSGDLIEDPKSEWFKLLKNPNPLLSGSQFWRSLIVYHQSFGQVFIIPRAERDLTGRHDMLSNRYPAALEIADPRKITAWKDGNILKGWIYSRGSGDGATEKFTNDEIIRIFELNPDDILKALAPWQPAGTAVTTDVRAAKYNDKFFEAGGHIQGVLELEGDEYEGMTTEEIDRIRAEWDSRFGGEHGAHKTPVLHGGLKYKPTGVSQKDMDFQNLRVQNREEVMAAYRVPKTILGLTDKVDRAVAKVFSKQFYSDNVIPLLRDIESVFNGTLFAQSGLYIEFDESAIESLSEENETNISNAQKLQSLGYSLNEINEKLGLGMDEISESWAGKPVDVRTTPTQETSTQEPTKSEDVPKTARQKAYAKNYDELSNKELQELYRDEVLEGRNMKRLEKKMNSYFTSLEKEQIKKLKTLEDSKGFKKESVDEILFDLTAWNALLVEAASQNIERAFEESADFLSREIGGFTGFDFESDDLVVAAMKKKKILITAVNNTVKEDVRSAIIAGLAENENVQQITERVRHSFEVSRSRSLTIARTEVMQSANASRDIAMKREGLRKQWVDAGDKVVRSTHQVYENMGPQDSSFDFSGGKNLKFPGDMDCTDPGEVINCRCITRAVR